MNPLRKKMLLDPFSKEKNEVSRRNFMSKSVFGLLDATVFKNFDELNSIKSRTGLIYVKQNGEIINHYERQGGDRYISEIFIIPFNFAPKGWMFCNGNLLPISQYTGLFSLIGTTFGGNGKVTFGLPDFRGRAPMHVNETNEQQPAFVLGDMGGNETVTLSTSQMPSHNHVVNVSSAPGDNLTPQDGFLATEKHGYQIYSTSAPNATLSSSTIGSTGAGTPFDIMQPYLVLTFCIAVQGIFPIRPEN